MRTIAKELGIKAASLYWHFENKMDLYAAIAEQLCTQIALPANDSAPQDFLSIIMREFRSVLLTVRDSVTVFELSHPNTPYRMAIIRLVGATLRELGVPPDMLMTVANLFNNYVLSFVADECRFRHISEKEMRQFHHNLTSAGDILQIAKNFDQQFDYGLKLLFAGLQSVVS